MHCHPAHKGGSAAGRTNVKPKCEVRGELLICPCERVDDAPAKTVALLPDDSYIREENGVTRGFSFHWQAGTHTCRMQCTASPLTEEVATRIAVVQEHGKAKVFCEVKMKAAEVQGCASGGPVCCTAVHGSAKALRQSVPQVPQLRLLRRAEEPVVIKTTFADGDNLRCTGKRRPVTIVAHASITSVTRSLSHQSCHP